jgi:glycosyltransferase involved in cell wall biosynthesis
MSLHLALVGDAGSVNVRNWAEALEGAGARVSLVSFARGDGVEAIGAPRGLGKARYLASGPAVRGIVRRIRPDVVVGYFVTGYGTLARLARHRPLVQVAVGSDVLVTPLRSLAGRMARRNLAAADLTLTLAPHMAEALARFGVPAGRVVTVPHGIDLDRFVADTPAGVPAGDFVTTRALRPFYRHELVLDAVARLDPPATLTIVGDGPERAGLERRAAGLGIAERVRFTGPVRQADLPALLAAHRVYVSAAPSDGVSASLLEAMALGLVPVVRDHTANRWWLEPDSSGVLVPGDTPDAYAAALHSALHDPRLRERAAARNPEVVAARGDRRRNAETVLNAFEGLVARPRA